jgi:putative ABC transport system substrate-binding protein
MRRREFIAGLGATAAVTAWPSAVRAQPAMPVVGYLYSGSLATPPISTEYLPAFRSGLKKSGYIEKQNVKFEYRLAEGQFERLAAMAADLVRRQVNVIVAPGEPATRSAKAATSTIPIVFTIGGDPVLSGLVASLNRPGGNATGIFQLAEELIAKQMQLLHETMPAAGTIAVLYNPAYVDTERKLIAVQAAANVLGLKIHALPAGNDRELESAFASLVELRIGALLNLGDIGFLTSRGDRILALAARHSVPTMHNRRSLVLAGGLMSYDTPLVEAYRIAGSYVGRILMGEKPAELPVQQSTKAELIINLKTARALGLDVPLSVRARADEVIE